MDYYQQALEIAKEIGDGRGEWKAELRRDLTYFIKAYEIREEIRRGKKNALGNLRRLEQVIDFLPRNEYNDIGEVYRCDS